MDNFSKSEISSINKSLKEFESKLRMIEPDSPDAYALVIFINACVDTGRFQTNRYSALNNFPKAKVVANRLETLIESPSLFVKAVGSAQTIIINHRLVDVDLCFG